jgi:hypothetical protein
MAETKANIPHDDFVAKVVKDPKQPPDTILLTGYVGKSSEEGHTRLHFDPELKNYVEIPNDAILHAQEIPKEHSSLGGSHVWIKSDAELIHGKVGPSRTKAKFFEGPIAAAAAAAGPGGGAGNSVLPACVVTDASVCACPGTIFVGDCPSIQCLPPTLQWTQCATPLHGCPPPTQQFTQCPTPLHGCPTPPAFCGHTPLPACLPHFTPGCPAQTAVCQAGVAAGAALGPLPPTQFSCPTHAPLLCPHTVQAPCISPLPHCAPSPPPLLCPLTPLHGCPPPPTPLCTHAPQCLTPGCHTPLHGCPTLPHVCVTQVCTIAPQCPTHPPVHCPTPPLLCPTPSINPVACPPHTPLHGCPTPPLLCPTPSINPAVCPLPHFTQQPQCVASPAPGCGPGIPDPGGPVEQAAFAAQAALLPTSPAICHLFTPACPSVHNICPTNPVICHPSPFCPTLHQPCLSQVVICHPSPFCPSPFCPTVQVPCFTTPGCPIPTPGCPFNPGGGGGNQ